jgi:hypothetical protein
VSDAANALRADGSDADFTIAEKPSITLTTPTGGQRWTAGSTQSIRWLSINVDSLRVDYSTDAGSTWTQIARKAGAATTTLWTVPATPSTQCRIRLTSLADASLSDQSDSNFTIALESTVTLQAPNGGEDWKVGSAQSIRWTSANVNTMKIEYTTNDGTTWSVLAAAAAAAPGSYTWTVPSTPSPICRVRVTDADVYWSTDRSDAVFTISTQPTLALTAPNGGEAWKTGTVQNIRWNSSGVNTVRIELSTDNGLNWMAPPVVNSMSAASGTYQWTVPNNVSQRCIVRITDMDNTAVTDISNGSFSIVSATNAVGEAGAAPTSISIEATYPNPARGESMIAFSLAHSAHARLEVFDAAGALVATVLDEDRAQGRHLVPWSTSGLPAGVYLCTLRAASSLVSTPIIVTR